MLLTSETILPNFFLSQAVVCVEGRKSEQFSLELCEQKSWLTKLAAASESLSQSHEPVHANNKPTRRASVIDGINTMSTMIDGGYTPLPPDESSVILYIGQHESQRSEPIRDDSLRLAQDIGYDLLTTPITTARFQSRVLATLEEHVNRLTKASSPDGLPLPLLSPLEPLDTDLTPEAGNSSLIAVTSSWIDLGSPDPLIAHISRQVFNLEVAYAAFCGINNVLIHGPIASEGTAQYARAVMEASNIGPYLQLHILLPMCGELEQDISAEGTHLSELARHQYASVIHEQDEAEPDLFASWDIWHTLRTICKYSTRLFIGTQQLNHFVSNLPITCRSSFPLNSCTSSNTEVRSCTIS